MTKQATLYNGEKTLISGAGKTGQLHIKEQRPKCKTRYYKTLRGKYRQNTF